MFISFFRTIKYALVDLTRNFWLSFITITMMILALISVNFLLLLNVVSTSAIEAIEKKVDISVFFRSEANENQIYEIQSTILSLPQVREVQLVSRDEALDLFKQIHANNSTLLESLAELEDNPLGATLIVQAKSAADFAPIIEVLENPKYEKVIAEKNFREHEAVISKIATISDQVKKLGLWSSILFTVIAIMVVFNTIRVSIYTHREEIKIMKLVGASNWFVKMPYVISAFLYSLIACGITVLLLYPVVDFLQPYLNRLLTTDAPVLMSYFTDNFLTVFGGQFGIAVILTVFSSLFAIGRYLRV